MTDQIIYSMVRVKRLYPPNNREVIRDISLSFFYGAKIGVLVDVVGSDENLRKDLAMHIAASKPVSLTKDASFSAKSSRANLASGGSSLLGSR